MFYSTYIYSVMGMKYTLREFFPGVQLTSITSKVPLRPNRWRQCSTKVLKVTRFFILLYITFIISIKRKIDELCFIIYYYYIILYYQLLLTKMVWYNKLSIYKTYNLYAEVLWRSFFSLALTLSLMSVRGRQAASVQFSLTVYVTDSALKAEQIRPSRCRSFGLEFKFSIY